MFDRQIFDIDRLDRVVLFGEDAGDAVVAKHLEIEEMAHHLEYRPSLVAIRGILAGRGGFLIDPREHSVEDDLGFRRIDDSPVSRHKSSVSLMALKSLLRIIADNHHGLLDMKVKSSAQVTMR